MPTPSSRAYSRDIVFLKRDPYARENQVRRSCITSDLCAWCGNPSGRKNLMYNYGSFRDAMNDPSWQKEVFCSKGCMQSFHS